MMIPIPMPILGSYDDDDDDEKAKCDDELFEN